MRIRYVRHPSEGAVEAGHGRDILAALQQLGHTVTGIPESRALPEQRELHGAVYLWATALWLAKGGLNKLGPWRPLWQLLRTEAEIALRERREWQGADVIYTRNRWLNLAEILLNKLYRVPLVIEINGIVADEMEGSGGRSLLWRIVNKVEHWNMKQADGWVVASSLTAETLHKDYGVPKERMTMAQFGADTELFKPDGSKGRGNTVCFVGTIWEVPRLDVLARAWPKIKSRCPQARMVLVGEDRLSLEGEAKSDWLFTGVVQRELVPTYINSADICVASLGWDVRHRRTGLCSLKLAEYMACGKPVVAARIPGLEPIEECGGGILIEPENEEQLVEAIVSLLSDQERAREMGEKGREYVVRERTWLKVAEKIAGALQEAIDEQHLSEESRLRLTARVIPKGGTLLDVGAHDNSFARVCASEEGIAAVGVDIDPEGGGAIPADALHLPFRDKSFDTVACLETLEHLTDDELPRAIAEIKRVAKEHIVVSVPNRCTLGVSGHLQLFSRRRLEGLFGRGEFHYYGRIYHCNEGWIRGALEKMSRKWLHTFNGVTNRRRWMIGVFRCEAFDTSREERSSRSRSSSNTGCG